LEFHILKVNNLNLLNLDANLQKIRKHEDWNVGSFFLPRQFNFFQGTAFRFGKPK